MTKPVHPRPSTGVCCPKCFRRPSLSPWFCPTCGVDFIDAASLPQQEVFFNVPASEVWVIEWRWVPSLFRKMIEDDPTQHSVVLRTLGNPWKRESFATSEASARWTVRGLKMDSPKKSFRFRPVPIQIQ